MADEIKDLKFRAVLDVEEVKRSTEQLKKELKGLGVSINGQFDKKPLTAYQEELLKIKREKEEQLRKDKEAAAEAKRIREAEISASNATQQALKEERLLIAQRNAEAAKIKLELAQQLAAEKALKLEKTKPKSVDMGESVAEVKVYTQAVNDYKETVNEVNKAQAEAANALAAYQRVNVEDTETTKKKVLSKKEEAKIVAEEKYRLAQTNKELRNHAREQMNAKGSIEQRRAALIRLQTAYDRLSVSERNSAAGQRMVGIIQRLNEQVLTLEKSTGRAQRNVGNYLTSAWNGLKMIANILPGMGIAGIFALAIDPIQKLIERTEIFGSKVREVSANALDGSFKEASMQAASLTERIKSAREGLISKQEVLKQYNETIGKTTGKLTTFAQLEKAEIDTLPKYMEMMRMKGEANALLAESINQIVEAQKRQVGNPNTMDWVGGVSRTFSQLTSGAGGSILKNGIWNKIKSETQMAQMEDVANITKTSKKLEEAYQKSIEKAKKFAKENGLNFYGDEIKNKDIKNLDQVYVAQRNMQARIDEMIAASKRKQLDDDAEEIANVKAKYDKLRLEAKNFNDDVDKYNAKNKVKRNKVDAGGLNAAEAAEIDLVIDKNAAKKLKSSLDESLKLYTEFEANRTKIGTDAAKKLASDRINTEISALEYLRAKYDELVGVDKKAKGSGMDIVDQEKIAEQLKVLKGAIEAEESLQKQKYIDLTAQYVDYQTKRKILTEQYEKDIANAQGNATVIKLRTEQYQKDLKDLDDANQTKLASYQKYFQNIENMSAKSAKRLLDKARTDFAKELQNNASLTKDQIDKINELFGEIEVQIANRTGQALQSLSQELNNIASQVGEINKEFGNIITTLGGVIGQLGNMRASITSLNTAQANKSVLGQFSSVLGIFGAGTAIFNTISKIFDRTEANAKKDQEFKQRQLAQQESLNKLLERQIKLINDAYGVEKIEKYSTAIKTATENEAKYSEQLANKYKLTGNSAADNIIKKLNEGASLNRDEKNVLAVLKKNNALQTIGSGLGLEDLQALLDSGNLDEVTSNLVANLIKAKESIIDLGNAAKESLTGTSFESFADGIVNALADGENGLKNFSDAIRKAMIESLKGPEFKKELQDWYDLFAQFAADGLEASEIEKLNELYDSLIEKQKERQALLEAASGIKLTPEDTPDILPDTDFEDFRSKLFNALVSGAKDGAEVAGDIIKQKLLDSIQDKVITDAFKPLQQQLALLFENGRIPTKEELAEVKAQFNTLYDSAKSQLKLIEELTGESLFETVSEDIGGAVEAVNQKLEQFKNSVFDVFNGVENGYENLMAKFDQMVQNSLMENFQEGVMAQRLTAFYEEFNQLNKVADTEKKARIEELRQQYEKIVRDGKQEFEELQNIFGVTPKTAAKPTDNQMSSGIARITEETAQTIAGPIIGSFEELRKIVAFNAKMFNLSAESLALLQSINYNTKRTADNTDRLSSIESGINELVRNTKGGATRVDNFLKL